MSELVTAHDPADPICPASEVPGSGCLCLWLAAARADERERIAEFLDSRGLENAAWFVRRIARNGGEP